MPELAERLMVVCETCGNKRCPHATDAYAQCTASNEPGQTPVIDEKQRAVAIAQAEHEYWAGHEVDEVRKRIAERDLVHV